MDRLTAMEIFAKVVETGSFVAASDALGISRPMASKHVASLEETLGVRLLNRTTRRLSLTEAGRSFHLRCQNIFEEIDTAIAEAGNLQAEAKGQLRINAPLTFGRAHLTPAIASFQTEHPEITIDLTLNDRFVDLVDEGFDLAIRIGRLADSSLIARKLAPCRMMICASPDYLARHGAPAHPSELADRNCLIYAYFSQEKRWSFETPEGEISVPVQGDFRVNFGEAVVEAAVAGRGIILEPTFTLAPHLAAGRLLPILTDFRPRELTVYAVYPAARLLPKKVRAFVDHLTAVFGGEPYWDKVAAELTL
ncbi:MAG: LysR family transcriptional regulator [Alphaproteobacteria bacterium]|nr:LysR family transcriptional regulator [Alphaproteobacteria bacterium]